MLVTYIQLIFLTIVPANLSSLAASRGVEGHRYCSWYRPLVVIFLAIMGSILGAIVPVVGAHPLRSIATPNTRQGARTRDGHQPQKHRNKQQQPR